MFLRLCWRAPLTLMRSMAIAKTSNCNGLIFARQVNHRLDRLKVKSEAEFHAAWRLCRGRVAEEWRRLDAGKRTQISVVQEIECLRIELETVLLRRCIRERGWCGAVTTTNANH